MSYKISPHIAASVSSGNLLEIQHFRLHSRLTVADSAFEQKLQLLHTCIKNRFKCFICETGRQLFALPASLGFMRELNEMHNKAP